MVPSYANPSFRVPGKPVTVDIHWPKDFVVDGFKAIQASNCRVLEPQDLILEVRFMLRAICG